MARRITTTELLARIEQLEASFGMANKTIEQLEAEMNAFYVAERPSRRMPRPEQFADTVVVPIASADHKNVVYMRGVPHLKVKAWEHGREVTTYKPLAQ